MATRWIKIDVTTPDKSAIRSVARDCNCSIGDAFLAFFRLYAWLDEMTADGILDADYDLIDRRGELPGLAASLERSGWLRFVPDGTCYVTNYCEHNGTSAKARALHAKRSASFKGRKKAEGEPVPRPPRRHLNEVTQTPSPR